MFDVIIDDGSHYLSDILFSLKTFFKLVNKGGFYVIEDYKHPNYYKELRKARNELAKRNAVKEDLACSGSSLARNNSDQVISSRAATAGTSVHPGPGHKQQATSSKPQASSRKLQAPRLLTLEKVSRHPNRGAGLG